MQYTYDEFVTVTSYDYISVCLLTMLSRHRVLVLVLILISVTAENIALNWLNDHRAPAALFSPTLIVRHFSEATDIANIVTHVVSLLKKTSELRTSLSWVVPEHCAVAGTKIVDKRPTSYRSDNSGSVFSTHKPVHWHSMYLTGHPF